MLKVVGVIFLLLLWGFSVFEKIKLVEFFARRLQKSPVPKSLLKKIINIPTRVVMLYNNRSKLYEKKIEKNHCFLKTFDQVILFLGAGGGRITSITV